MPKVKFYYYEFYGLDDEDRQINICSLLGGIRNIQNITTEYESDDRKYKMHLEKKTDRGKDYYFGYATSPEAKDNFYAQDISSIKVRKVREKATAKIGKFESDYTSFILRKSNKDPKNLVVGLETGFQTAGVRIFGELLKKLLGNTVEEINKRVLTTESFATRKNRYANKEVTRVEIDFAKAVNSYVRKSLSNIIRAKFLKIFNRAKARVSVSVDFRYATKKSKFPIFDKVFEAVFPPEVQAVMQNEANIPDLMHDFRVKIKGENRMADLLTGFLSSEIDLKKVECTKKIKRLYDALQPEFESKVTSLDY
jgi:hypothetical protein